MHPFQMLPELKTGLFQVHRAGTPGLNLSGLHWGHTFVSFILFFVGLVIHSSIPPGHKLWTIKSLGTQRETAQTHALSSWGSNVLRRWGWETLTRASTSRATLDTLY